ncbi:MAG: phospholipase D family protein [Woeseiaceae bacterium]|nr:phospholipase D family protein [Woeseiaceae bacterium]
MSQFPESTSGFLPLVIGPDALAARLSLIRRATARIDIQYYLIKDDIVGRAFFDALLNAADRGVQVRILLDDMFTSGQDRTLVALDEHPNLEIRIFNPFRRRFPGRHVSALLFARLVNRRLHNKSFTVDDVATILGGRNIADEYFGAREDARFGDFDVLATGTIVDGVSASFDEYWEHPAAVPLARFMRPVEDQATALRELRSALTRSTREIAESKYANAIRYRIDLFERLDLAALPRSPYRLLVDSPDKGLPDKAAAAGSIMTPILESLMDAQSEVVIISPYFVPRKRGLERLKALVEKGTNVTIVTNSLAANNQFLVHGGYAPSRKRLLRLGVRIHEVRPDANVPGTEFVNASGARATLHTKAYVVDRRDVFIGSFNFDPRSANINTEIGVLIRDPELAREHIERMQGLLPGETYELFLTDHRRLGWRCQRGGKTVIYHNEPRTSPSQRAIARLARCLPIRGQL